MTSNLRIHMLYISTVVMLVCVFAGAIADMTSLMGVGFIVWLTAIGWIMKEHIGIKGVTWSQMVDYTSDQAEKYRSERKYVRSAVYGSVLACVVIGVMTVCLMVVAFFLM